MPRVLLASALAFVCACASAPPAATPPPGDTTAPAPASAAPSVAPSTSTAPSATPTAAPAPSRAEEPAGPPDPAPLTEAEQKEAEKKCKPLMQALQGKKGSGPSPLDALHAALQKPPASLKPADLSRCEELLTRGIQTYLIAAKEVEAKVVMKRIERAVVAAYTSSAGKLCPSSEHPVPADKALVAKDPYVSTDADWSTPAWKCLDMNLAGQPQRFQYEVRVDPSGASFEIIARGVPGARWVELRERGAVSNKAISVGAIERR